MIKKRLNVRMSGLGGQGAVTAAHVLAMAANRDGKFSISNPFFGAEKRMAPAESYCRIGIERIYDRGELVFPERHPGLSSPGHHHGEELHHALLLRREGRWPRHHQLRPATSV